MVRFLTHDFTTAREEVELLHCCLEDRGYQISQCNSKAIKATKALIYERGLTVGVDFIPRIGFDRLRVYVFVAPVGNGPIEYKEVSLDKFDRKNLFDIRILNVRLAQAKEYAHIYFNDLAVTEPDQILEADL